ncbi:hypothetical protein V8F33_012235 [Rhypophila sp. PSN 637]
MTSKPAYTRVLGTAELLELILFHLPMQDLLVTAQRVSRAWKSAIDSSPTLQQTLFLRPEADVPSASSVPHTEEAARHQQPTTSFSSFTFNPVLQKTFPWWFRSDPRVRSGSEALAALPWASDPIAQAAVMRADASWRNMLPCQPPKLALELVGKRSTKHHFFEMNGLATFPDCIRMGTLYDLGFEKMRIWLSGFWIQWHLEQDSPGRPDRIVMFTHHTWRGDNPKVVVTDEFRSEAYQDVVIPLKEEGRGRGWYQGFGVEPPARHGGWRLRQPPAADLGQSMD